MHTRVARHSPFVTACLLALLWSREAPAALESLDLASLFAGADAVVLVESFTSAGPTRPGTCVVKKSYFGSIEPDTRISVIPWSSRLDNPAAAIRARTGLTCVFFLKRQREGAFWGTELSGIRVIGEEQVLGLAAGGSSLYELTPAASEGLRPLPEGKSYDHTALDEDLASAADRARRVQKALDLPSGSGAVAHLKEILEEEASRVFPGAAPRPAVTRSELVLKLVQKLLELREIELVWSVRARIPSGPFRAELDARLVERATLEFIRSRLEDVPRPEASEMLAVLATSGFRARNDIKPELLRRIFGSLGSLAGEDRFAGHAAIVELYRGLPLDPEDLLLSKLVSAVGSGDGTALYHFGPLITEREPLLATKVLPDQSKLFGLVTIEEASVKRVRGRVNLRRLPAGHSFGKPEVVFVRTGGNTAVVEIRKHSLDASSDLFALGKSGTSSVSFSAGFEEQPLPGGGWRAFIESTWSGSTSGTWRSGGTSFQLAP